MISSDKLYVIIIIGMIGIFIYWYQTRLDLEAQTSSEVYCAGCKRRMIKRKDKRKRDNEQSTSQSRHTSRKSKKSRKTSKQVRFEDESMESDDSIPDSIIEARLQRSKRSKSPRNVRDDDESEISIESLDTVERSEISNSRRDNDTLDMVDDTIDSDADTIDLD